MAVITDTKARNLKPEDSRIINDDHVVLVTAHLCWDNTEKALQRSPHGLASVEGLKGIMDLVQLYRRRELLQLPYNETDGNQCAVFPAVVAMKLELCHQIACSLSGSNSPNNIIIGPKNINRRLHHSLWLPASSWSKKLFGRCFCPKKGSKLVQQTAEGAKLVSLLTALKAEYQENDIIWALSSWSPPGADDAQKIRPFRLPPLPLGMLLRDELLRLKKRIFIAIRTRFQCIEIHYGGLLGYYTEVIAIAIFIALQTADNEGLLKLFVNNG